MRGRGGFTFIEIMLVIVIMAVLAVMSFPRLKGSFGLTQVKAAARDVTGVLRYARNTAVMRERPCEVRFSPDNDLYQLVLLDERNERIDDRSNRRNREDADYWGEMTEVRQLPRNVHFAAIYAAAPLTDDTRLPRVIYYPDGSATATTIAIQDTGRRSISVEVYRTTGMARVEKGLPPEEPRLQTIYYGPGDRKLIREVD